MVLRYPLDYPDPADPLYGYTRKRIAEWYPASVPSAFHPNLLGSMTS